MQPNSDASTDLGDSLLRESRHAALRERIREHRLQLSELGTSERLEKMKKHQLELRELGDPKLNEKLNEYQLKLRALEMSRLRQNLEEHRLKPNELKGDPVLRARVNAYYLGKSKQQEEPMPQAIERQKALDEEKKQKIEEQRKKEESAFVRFKRD